MMAAQLVTPRGLHLPSSRVFSETELPASFVLGNHLRQRLLTPVSQKLRGMKRAGVPKADPALSYSPLSSYGGPSLSMIRDISSRSYARSVVVLTAPPEPAWRAKAVALSSSGASSIPT